MRRLLVFTVALLLCLPGIAPAEQYREVFYTTTQLRLRAQPSISAKVIATLAAGAPVQVDLGSKQQADGLVWVPGHALRDGLHGWLALRYLEASSPTGTSSPATVPSSWRPARTTARPSDESDPFGIVMAVWLVGYMLPTLIALARRHHNLLAICFLDLLAGWTVIGWFIAFIWSLTAVRRPAAA